MRKIGLFLCSICIFFVASAVPPDKPIMPQEFAAEMGSGAWLILRGPLSAKKARPAYNPEIPKILKKNGCPGGRLHIGISDQLDLEKMEIPPETLKFIHEAVDGFLAEGMYLLMMVEIVKGKNLSERDLQLQYKIWDKICFEMKDKSHRLAMAPFIEWHGWEKESKEDCLKKFNKLQARCTHIFRKYNPTRILGYKGIASSRVNGTPWECLDIPYGDKSPYYLVCGSAASLGTAHHSQKWKDWGINEKYTDEEMKKEIYNFIKPALLYREKTGTAVVIDHWTAGLHSNNIDGKFDLEAMGKSKRAADKREYAKLMRYKAKAEKKGKVFAPRKYSLDQRIAFAEYVGNIVKDNGLGAAGEPHIIDIFWDIRKNIPIVPAKGSVAYKRQEAARAVWGKSSKKCIK